MDENGVCPSHTLHLHKSDWDGAIIPPRNTASQSDMNIANVMLWTMKNAYKPTTVKRVAKELRHLERNCNTSNPEDVKLYISSRQCSNGHKENLIEAYAVYMRSENRTWN